MPERVFLVSLREGGHFRKHAGVCSPCGVSGQPIMEPSFLILPARLKFRRLLMKDPFPGSYRLFSNFGRKERIRE
ncbi:MAG: hypothetical protein AMJ94_01495 [Deltaproteobacteria bacterium SM23_61]|nr:MAG: hypothetical protein AMJ94_01495 [Deltaproteobacteria bacterium SM23_61]